MPEAGVRRLDFDYLGLASLDGTWEFFPGEHTIDSLQTETANRIKVPGLWESQGHLELDGPAWYRTRFQLDDVSGHWTLRFGAVMDIADVYLNGKHLGSHDLAFTPFEFDAGPALQTGTNELLVRVFDPSIDDPVHNASPHGKQGWANWVFPSRPSLYMTYGGIWQSVTLRRHGALVIDDVFVNSDPEEVKVEVTVSNRGRKPVQCRVYIRALGELDDEWCEMPAGDRRAFKFSLGPSAAPRWSPEHPNLHLLMVDVKEARTPSDERTVRFGLRKITIEGTRLLVDGTLYRMKSVLVQGFRPDGLYSEGSREAIQDEVGKAKAMGFNTVRLHIKAFNPAYLEVCDEMGMFVHSDIPVAEPIDHENLGADTELALRCRRAAREQVIRDRNHPSILLWSAMNELGLDRIETRAWDRYEQFVRVLYEEVRSADPTRPVIENDWVEPDPDRVFCSPILTAHWYGRLHAEYLESIEKKAMDWTGAGKPLYVTEFGDWGLPAMPKRDVPPFWDTRELYAVGLAKTLWPATVERFVIETQRYQGLSDRFQIEVFRRHDHIGGYCLTELTDVPHELNGVLDLDRNPKRIAVEEIARANQQVLPMLKLDSFVMTAGSGFSACAFVANDGPSEEGITAECWFGDAPGPTEGGVIRIDHLEGYTASAWGNVHLTAPTVPGSHDLIVVLKRDGSEIARNRYPMHIVPEPSAVGRVNLIGDSANIPALEKVGAEFSKDGILVIGERALDAAAGTRLREHLASGRTAVVLAQEAAAAANYPLPVEMAALATAWGSSIFRFTNDEGWMPSLPRRNVLTTEDSTIHPGNVIVSMGDRLFPDTPIVIAYKPAPDPLTGTLIGSTAVGAGSLVFCQYRLCEHAAVGDAAALAVLADVIRAPERLASRPVVERMTKSDGRRLSLWWLPGTGKPA
ncbi:MAG TPA: glycoside hydrolase family 2 TIM barrel-domain containing protein [Actinomycetota bacterium]|nr:glycoside hydrolase family 2 TIM barrel-domain containing protein [Actinomycetota bacterium]